MSRSLSQLDNAASLAEAFFDALSGVCLIELEAAEQVPSLPATLTNPGVTPKLPRRYPEISTGLRRIFLGVTPSPFLRAGSRCFWMCAVRDSSTIVQCYRYLSSVSMLVPSFAVEKFEAWARKTTAKHEGCAVDAVLPKSPVMDLCSCGAESRKPNSNADLVACFRHRRRNVQRH